MTFLWFDVVFVDVVEVEVVRRNNFVETIRTRLLITTVEILFSFVPRKVLLYVCIVPMKKIAAVSVVSSGGTAE